MEHVGRRRDRLAAAALGRRDQPRDERVAGVAFGEDEHLGDDAGLDRLGDDPQPFGEEAPVGAAVFLLVERPQRLERRIGGAGERLDHTAAPSTTARAKPLSACVMMRRSLQHGR